MISQKSYRESLESSVTDDLKRLNMLFKPHGRTFGIGFIRCRRYETVAGEDIRGHPGSLYLIFITTIKPSKYADQPMTSLITSILSHIGSRPKNDPPTGHNGQ